MKGKKILITGGAGFIGSHLAARLAEENDVVVLDDLSSGTKDNLKGLPVMFVKGSILNKKLVEDLTKGCSYVFHLAAMASVQDSVEFPEKCFQVNIVGSNIVMDASVKHNVKKVVFCSSAAIYGDDPRLPKTEMMIPLPISPYAASKLAIEQQCIVNHKLHNLEFACLRLFNVFGPKQNPKSPYSSVISKFMFSALNNETLLIYGDGSQTRDFIFVDDVVNAIIKATDSPKSGMFNIASSKRITVKGLANMIVGLADSESRIELKPAREGDIKHSWASTKKARALLNWNPIFSMQEGLAKTINWFKQK